MNAGGRVAVLSLLAASLATAQNPLDSLHQIARAATRESHTYAYLQELSNTMGPRLTGSPAAQQATEWAEHKGIDWTEERPRGRLAACTRVAQGGGTS